MGRPTEISFVKYENNNGVLCVYECGQSVPFNIKRVFTVSANAGDVRGEHAHKQCAQLLVCVSGKILVSCDDGMAVTEYALDQIGKGVLVPPGTWAREEYLDDNTVLMVMCDRVYEVDDYIRDYQDFKTFILERES